MIVIDYTTCDCINIKNIILYGLKEVPRNGNDFVK